MEIISMDIRTFDALMTRVKTIEEKADILCKRQEDLGLKKWLDNQEVCDILGISKRTLQEYRAKGLLPFGRIKNKLFYKPEDVEKVLQQDPRVADLLRRLENTGRALKKMEPNCQRSFNGERFMNDVELAKLLRISRRTLQEYRSLRILPYYLIQGKVLYKESEIQQLLEEAHRKCLDEQQKWL